MLGFLEFDVRRVIRWPGKNLLRSCIPFSRPRACFTAASSSVRKSRFARGDDLGMSWFTARSEITPASILLRSNEALGDECLEHHRPKPVRSPMNSECRTTTYVINGTKDWSPWTPDLSLMLELPCTCGFKVHTEIYDHSIPICTRKHILLSSPCTSVNNRQCVLNQNEK